VQPQSGLALLCTYFADHSLHARKNAADDADIIPDAEPTAGDDCQPARVKPLAEFAETRLIVLRRRVFSEEIGSERILSVQPLCVPFHGCGVIAIREQVEDTVRFLISRGAPHRNTFAAFLHRTAKLGCRAGAADFDLD
jgi:hypothetical protein